MVDIYKKSLQFSLCLKEHTIETYNGYNSLRRDIAN